MKRMIVRENVHGRITSVNAKTTYQTDSGKWVAEIGGTDINHACEELCRGIENCTCDNLRVEADVDDDGKEYSLVSK